MPSTEHSNVEAESEENSNAARLDDVLQPGASHGPDVMITGLAGAIGAVVAPAVVGPGADGPDGPDVAGVVPFAAGLPGAVVTAASGSSPPDEATATTPTAPSTATVPPTALGLAGEAAAAVQLLIDGTALRDITYLTSVDGRPASVQATISALTDATPVIAPV